MYLNRLQRYVPLVCWIVTVLTLICIPMKILSEGYQPIDDTLRHAAKVVSGKPWSEILVMRPGFTMDPHPGWHALLGVVYHTTNCSTEALVVTEVFGAMTLVLLVVLPWFRRPEAWLMALLVLFLTAPMLIERLALGRPFLFTMAASLVLLLIWSRTGPRPGWGTNLSTLCLVGACAWIHGGFYQLILPAVALMLATRYRQALWFGADWVAGSIAGAALTGHPWQFLDQSVRFLLAALGGHSFMKELVVEFQPTDGACMVILAVIAMLLWRSRSPDWKPVQLLEPVFMTAVLGWVLGLANGRFWYEWGMPATLLWMALQFQAQLESGVSFASAQRLVLTGGVGLALFLSGAADRGSRWTGNLKHDFINADDPKIACWMPGKDGILYNADMDVFYTTFYANPKASWRYMMGFEPAMMPPEDLRTQHQILWDPGNPVAYEPWVKRMGPNDRLFVTASWLRTTTPPAIPELEWALAGRNTWIGRKPVQSGDGSSPPKSKL
jgi:hypothetical protein